MIVSYLIYFYWPATVALLAWSESGIIPALREYVPASSPFARAAVNSLHVRLTLLYFLPVLVPLPLWRMGWVPGAFCWKWVVVAGVSRLLFDICLNWFCKVPLLSVGQTAASDRLIRKLSPARPEALALVARIGLAVAGLAPLFIW